MLVEMEKCQHFLGGLVKRDVPKNSRDDQNESK
jgi:hypothetical protein